MPQFDNSNSIELNWKCMLELSTLWNETKRTSAQPRLLRAFKHTMQTHQHNIGCCFTLFLNICRIDVFFSRTLRGFSVLCCFFSSFRQYFRCIDVIFKWFILLVGSRFCSAVDISAAISVSEFRSRRVPVLRDAWENESKSTFDPRIQLIFVYLKQNKQQSFVIFQRWVLIY